MQMMRAVTLKGFGDASMLQVSCIPKAAITRGTDVLIKVKAAGVNRADIVQRSGHYPPPKGCSEVLGLEVSGVVEQVGKDVSNVKEGDKVMALLTGGGYAEYAVAHAGSVMPMPEHFTFVEAAAIPETFLTVWQALTFHSHVNAGDKVLIHAGASGIGVAASQITEKYFGATAVTTSSEGKVDVCKQFASICLSRTPDETGLCFASKVKDLLGEGAINVVIDPVVGDGYIAEDASLLAEDGHIVALALLGGSKVQLDMSDFFKCGATVVFSKLRNKSDEYKAALVDSFVREVEPLIAAHSIISVVHSSYALEEVARAHTALESNSCWGKLILRVDE